jgi:nucleoside-diphosphate-sugar epimerase
MAARGPGLPREDRSDRVVLVTGASSLLGRIAIGELLARGCRVIALLRHGSPHTVDSLSSSVAGLEGLVPRSRLELLRGDVLEPDLGLEADGLARAQGATEVLHLARPRAGEEVTPGALAKAVDNVVDVSRRLPALRRLVVLSSTDLMGTYIGRFYEDWLDVGQVLPDQRSRDVLEAEVQARKAADYLPVCVVRHALLVGHTRTGQMECDAGFGRVLAWGFRAAHLPSFVRLPAPAPGRRFVVVSPVDFLAEGLAEITFAGDVAPAETFCVADPDPPTLAELYETVLDRAGGPAIGLRIPVEGKGPIGLSIEALAQAGESLTRAFGADPGFLPALLRRGDHDTSNARRVLARAGVVCPRLATYLDVLYQDFLRRHGRSW